MDQKTVDDYIIKVQREFKELEDMFDEEYYAGRIPPEKPVLDNLPAQVQLVIKALQAIQQPRTPPEIANQMPPGAKRPPMR